MTYRTFTKSFSTLVLLPVCLTLSLAGLALGESYYLRAGVTVIPARTFNNPKAITMWGFAKCDAAFANCSSVQVPGPTLTATAGQSLSITLMNNLNGRYKEPVSLVIPGLIKAMTPVWIDPVVRPFNPSAPAVATGNRPVPATPANQNDPAYRYRVRSFDAETPADATTTTTYTWAAANVKEGTYLYQSGTHPSVQVQMGLYGPLIVYPGAGQAFGAPGSVYAAAATQGGNAARPAVAYDTEAVILFSEIDPALHDAIATGHYGPTPPLLNPQANWMTSTANYTPRHFLVNGAPYSPTSPAIPAGNLGQTVLLRFLNAGLATKVPALQDSFNLILSPPTPLATPTNPQVNLPYMTIIAEDGYPVPWLKQQASLLLPAGKTMDAVITTTTAVGATTSPGANIAIYDRRVNLTNSPLTPGGQLTYLNVGTIPAINVFPTFADFGTIQLFNPVQKLVTLKNNGLKPLIVSNTINGTDKALFQTDWNAQVRTIAPGKSDSIQVLFSSTTPGTKSATLRVTSNDPNQGTIDIPLSVTVR